jgi:hypothetical protein
MWLFLFASYMYAEIQLLPCDHKDNNGYSNPSLMSSPFWYNLVCYKECPYQMDQNLQKSTKINI